MLIFCELTYTFNSMLLKAPAILSVYMCVCVDLDKLIPEYIQKSNWPSIGKIPQKNKVGTGLTT